MIKRSGICLIYTIIKQCINNLVTNNKKNKIEVNIENGTVHSISMSININRRIWH